jgi:hypothetical protein
MPAQRAWLEERWEAGQRVVTDLLAMEPRPTATLEPGQVPRGWGLYAFSVVGADDGRFLRAGHTDNLARRICTDHLRGSQAGDLSVQLRAAGEYPDLAAARWFVQHNCVVRWVQVPDAATAKWAELLMLGVLRPQYADLSPRFLGV